MLQHDEVTCLVYFYNQVKLNKPSFAPYSLYVANWRFQILSSLRVTPILDLDVDAWRLSNLAKIMLGKSVARQRQTHDSNLCSPILCYLNLLEKSLFLKRKAAQSMLCATSAVLEKST